jgi:hypothetical protein
VGMRDSENASDAPLPRVQQLLHDHEEVELSVVRKCLGSVIT